MKTCINCPGRTDHSTAECPMIRDDLTADSAQARAANAFRANASIVPTPFDWQAAQQRRELEEANMKVRVRMACERIEAKLVMGWRAHP